jgi:hypothetical protein
MNRARRTTAALTILIATVALCALTVPPVVAAGAAPSVRLLAGSPSVTLHRYGPRGRVWLDVGIYIAAAGGAFEIRVGRDDYDHPIEVEQHIYQGTGWDRPLPASVARGMVGLRRFLHVTVTNAAGTVVLDRYHAFCPSGELARVNDNGPQVPRYPQFCTASPFTLGTVWGVDDGWAVGALGYNVNDSIKGPDGRYTVTVTIPDRYVNLLGIAPEDATASVEARVVTDGGGSGCPPLCEGAAARRDGVGGPSRSTPQLPDPDAGVEPDLVALPAWGIFVDSRRDRDFLDFGATVWNAGPSPLVVEGFRRATDALMDAFQYFYRADGTLAGRAPAGELEYDASRGHEHWHFEQFARYSLLDASQSEVVVSRKEAFCLAPTDAIDLLAPGAEWNPGSIGLGTACGGPSSIWIREWLPAGWGDTYFQGLPGQSFDITDLPNGTYYIAVQANPLGVLHERSTENNVELRQIILGGAPGRRTVDVPPWHGIDTEGGGGTSGPF